MVVCQKSKIGDWIEHFNLNYPKQFHVLDLTDKHLYIGFWEYLKLSASLPIIGVINYELTFRRKELAELEDFTLLLDESSMIQNETAKRTKFILNLHPKNVILLSGTPVGGKYENLYSQIQLLGWRISKSMYWNQYIDFHAETRNGFPLKVVDGYKNVDRLKRKLRDHGAHFLQESDLFALPEQIHQTIKIPVTNEYKTFKRDRIVEYNGIELVGDTALTKMLYQRQLCGQYNENKLIAFRDLLNSTSDRFIVFYNFNDELKALKTVVEKTERSFGEVNGNRKQIDAIQKEGCVLFVQYQAGAMGLNLQIANRIIYFTPPLSSELFEQSKKRTHRIGQDKKCFYYYLTCSDSIEERIYRTLEMRKDYTEYLFTEENENEK